MSYVSPYESIVNLFWTAVPVYDWEPVPPVTPPPDSEGCVPPAPAADGMPPDAGNAAGLPTMQLVYKGLRWVAVPVWSMRQNAAFDQISQDQRDEADARAQARRPRAPPSEAASDAPSTPAATAVPATPVEGVPAAPGDAPSADPR